VSRDDSRTAGRDDGDGPDRVLRDLGDLATLMRGETPTSRTFITGLIAGALVGAAVAGGTWIRHRSRRGA
jgi:hypothetical protein